MILTRPPTLPHSIYSPLLPPRGCSHLPVLDPPLGSPSHDSNGVAALDATGDVVVDAADLGVGVRCDDDCMIDCVIE